MSHHKYPRRSPEIGRVAARLLTIPVMALALLAAYVLLRMSHDEPAVLADAVPAHEALDPVSGGRDATP